MLGSRPSMPRRVQLSLFLLAQAQGKVDILGSTPVWSLRCFSCRSPRNSLTPPRRTVEHLLPNPLLQWLPEDPSPGRAKGPAGDLRSFWLQKSCFQIQGLSSS